MVPYRASVGQQEIEEEMTATQSGGDSVAPVERYAFRVGEAAALLGISRSKAYIKIRAGELPSVKLGGSRRIPADALRKWISQKAA
jgi:excisionase family DNA binding protein